MYIFVFLAVLASFLLCNGFIIGSFRNAGFGRRPSLPVLKPQQLTRSRPQTRAGTPLWLASRSSGFNASALTRLSAAVDQKNMHVFVQELKALADSRIGQTMPQPEAESLMELMDRAAERIVHNSDVADWISSLGKLGFQASIPKQRALIVKSVQQLSRAKGLSGRDIGMSLDGLVKTGLKLSDLSDELRVGVLEVVEQAADQLNPRGIATVLTALCKLGEAWSSLPLQSQRALFKSFEKNAQRMNSWDAATAVHSLGQLSLCSQSLTDEQRGMVFNVSMKGIAKESVKQRSAAQVNQDISMTIYGLGQMQFAHDGLPSQLRKGIESCLLHSPANMDGQSISNIIHAFGQMRHVWATVTPVLQAAFQQAAGVNLSGMTPQEVSMTLVGLADMSAKWDSLMPELRKKIEQAVISVVFSSVLQGRCNEQAVANSIHSLGKMAAPWKSFSPTFHTAAVDAFISLQDKFIPQGIANFIYGLGCMGAPFQDLSPAFMTAVQKTVLRLSAAAESFDSQAISNILLGFANMGASWDRLPAKKELEHLLVRLAPNMIAQGLVNSMHSLGKMVATWKSFSPFFHAAVLDAFILLQDKFNTQGVANFIYGLGGMGTPFQDLNPAFMTAVQKTVHRLSVAAESFNSQDISIILLGFTRMGASWDQLPTKELEHLLVRLAPIMNEQIVANSVYSLAVMEASWSAMSNYTVRPMASALEAIAPTMTAKEVANSLYGLTLLCFDFQFTSMGLSPAELDKEQLMWRMVRALVKRFRVLAREEYGKEHFCQFAIFFEWLSGLPGGMELITEELDNRPAFRNPNGFDAPTSLHLALSQALPKALQKLQPAGQFRIVNEFDGLGGHVFDVDMAVHQDGKLISFVEVDGSSHYSADGKQLKRIDLLKETLYANRYPLVALHRVRNEQLWPNKLAGSCGVLAEAILKQCKVSKL